MSLRAFTELPSSETVKRIAYDAFEVIDGIVTGTHLLIVRGTAPCINMEVRLSPRIYIDCPQYWAIEVTGTLLGSICLPTMRPYIVSIPLDGITGYRGIELVGAHQSNLVDVTGGCAQGQSLAGEAGAATADSETITVDSDRMTADGGVTSGN